VTEAVQDALNNLDTPVLADLQVNQPELLEEIRRVMEKKVNNRAVMPEEFNLLGKFADLVEKRLVAKRDTARQARLAEINAVKSTLPQQAFKQPINALDLTEDILEALQPLENVGEIMWRFLIDEDRLRRMLADLPNDSLAKVQAALDMFVMPEEAVEQVAEITDEVAEPVVAAAPDVAEVGEVLEAVDDEELAPAAFPDEPVIEVPPADRGQPARKPAPPRKEAVPAADAEVEEDDEDDVDLLLTGGKKKEKKKKKKERQQRRQLIFDEEIGQVIAKRRRKGGRGDSWDDEE
jgi:hypothetical protein